MKVCPVCQREYPEDAARCSEDGVPLVALGRDTRARSDDLIGEVVEGRWKIERVIGKGGMGTVYSCRHLIVGKVAALKVLRTGPDKSEAVLQRFVREAQAANLVRSRHIVEISDFGQLPSGALFVVMELLEGRDLSKAMRAGMSRRDLVHVFIQVAEALQLAHEKGIVHRDLKPDNVYLVEEAGDPLFVKLLDFGIAKVMNGEGNGGLTETGVILGTPYYMSPEQARAEGVDHRTDVYALGVMMYRAFTGRLPFMADSTMGVLTRHITETPQPPSEIASVDLLTERMILRCLAKRPEYRFQSMRELADALRQVPVEAPIPAPATYGGQLTSPSQAGSAAHLGMISPSGHHSAMTGPHTPSPTSASIGAPISAPTSGSMMGLPPSEPTTRGVTSSASLAPVTPPRSNGLLLAVGALSTAAIGAVVALVVFRPTVAPPPVAPVAPAAPAHADVVQTAAPAGPATVTPAPSATASGPASPASGSSATPSASSSASSASSASKPPGRTPSTPGTPSTPTAPPPKPTSAPPPPEPRLPNGVRSPFG